MKNTIFTDLGVIDYKQAWDIQKCEFQKLLDYKMNGGDIPEQKVLFCEHPHVFTLGRFGDQNNFLINDEFLKKINATYYKIDRGGDITYHGYGQIVCYPILDLEVFKISLKEYIERLEEVVIRTVVKYGIVTERLAGATGVWINADKQDTRKICAIGVKASRFVTMHGLALNVNTDLDYYSHINPCGFTDKGVTSIEKETGKIIPLREVVNHMISEFSDVFK